MHIFTSPLPLPRRDTDTQFQFASVNKSIRYLWLQQQFVNLGERVAHPGPEGSQISSSSVHSLKSSNLYGALSIKCVIGMLSHVITPLCCANFRDSPGWSTQYLINDSWSTDQNLMYCLCMRGGKWGFWKSRVRGPNLIDNFPCSHARWKRETANAIRGWSCKCALWV